MDLQFKKRCENTLGNLETQSDSYIKNISFIESELLISFIHIVVVQRQMSMSNKKTMSIVNVGIGHSGFRLWVTKSSNLLMPIMKFKTHFNYILIRI